MPALPNGRWERFALEIAQGSSAKTAMETAGYADRRNCTRPLKTPAIAARIVELRGTAAERAVITLELLMEEAEEARRRPWQAANAALPWRPSGSWASCRASASRSGT